MAPSGDCTQSTGETLDLLLATHFPNLIDMEGGAVLAAACRTNCLDWQMAARIVTYQKVGWAIDSFAPYKSPGMDGIFPALLQEGWDVLIPCLVRIFRACLATGYVPAMWRQVKVVFIPKPGRNSYCQDWNSKNEKESEGSIWSKASAVKTDAAGKTDRSTNLTDKQPEGFCFWEAVNQRCFQ